MNSAKKYTIKPNCLYRQVGFFICAIGMSCRALDSAFSTAVVAVG